MPKGMVLVRTILQGGLKIAIALIIAVAVVAAAAVGIYKLYEARQKLHARPYEEVTTWSLDTRSALGMSLNARSKLVDGQMFVELVFDQYPSYLSAPKNREGTLSFGFLDKDGFNLFSKEIAVRDFTRLVDQQGKARGLRHEFAQFVRVEDYSRYSKIDVKWNLDTAPVVPPEVEDALVKEKPTLDHCAPGLSKAERLKRLAQFGSVRQTGSGEYTADGRKVVYLGDTAEMYSCN